MGQVQPLLRLLQSPAKRIQDFLRPRAVAAEPGRVPGALAADDLLPSAAPENLVSDAEAARKLHSAALRLTRPSNSPDFAQDVYRTILVGSEADLEKLLDKHGDDLLLLRDHLGESLPLTCLDKSKWGKFQFLIGEIAQRGLQSKFPKLADELIRRGQLRAARDAVRKGFEVADKKAAVRNLNLNPSRRASKARDTLLKVLAQ